MRILRVFLPLFVAMVAVLGAPTGPRAQVGVSVAIAPPPLPVYTQPPIPAPGYNWTPGYWGHATAGYYWVPGTWVRPPAVGLLWTPGYWGWGGSGFAFHAGFWGAHVGFYGGINYGFGYAGVGFAGGYWAHGAFFYNRAVNNFGNTHITNVYNKNVTINRTTNVSYNGGAGGIQSRPTSEELAAEHDQHVGPTEEQVRHQAAASNDRSLQASVNHGNPPIAATSKPGELTGHGVAAARGGESRPAAAAEHRGTSAGRGGQGPAHTTQASQQHRSGTPQARHAAPERQPAAHRPPEHQD